MSNLYEQLKKLCVEHRISILQLEKEMKVSNGSIGKWKTGTPRADILYKVSKYFNVPMEYFFTDNSINIENNLNNSSYNNVINNSSHCTITISNGSTHTFELSEYEKELFRIYQTLNIRNKSELLTEAYKLESSQKGGD